MAWVGGCYLPVMVAARAEPEVASGPPSAASATRRAPASRSGARSRETPKKGQERLRPRPSPSPAQPARWGRRGGGGGGGIRPAREVVGVKWGRRGGPRHSRDPSSGDTQAWPAASTGHVLPSRASLATSPDSGHSFPFKGSEVIITANKPPSPAGMPCLELPLRCPGLPRKANTGGGRGTGGHRGTILRPPPCWLQALNSHCGPGQRGDHLHAFIPQSDVSGRRLPPERGVGGWGVGEPGNPQSAMSCP